MSLTEELDEPHDDDDEVLHTDPVVAVSVAPHYGRQHGAADRKP